MDKYLVELLAGTLLERGFCEPVIDCIKLHCIVAAMLMLQIVNKTSHISLLGEFVPL